MSFTPATIQIGTGAAANVQFNPASLRVTTTNQIEDDSANQVSKPTTFKLDVELLFDTTHDGSDVYQKTRPIRDAATASAQGATQQNSSGGGSRNRSSRASPSLSLVTFTWGTSIYKGYIESLNETLDYWSSDGVPLRATLQLSIKGTTDNFLTGTYGQVADYGTNPAPTLPEIVLAGPAPGNTTDLLQRGLAAPSATPSTGRGIAAFNGLENMRGGIGALAGASVSAGAGFSAGAGASAGAGLAVGGGAQLQAAAGFKMAGGVSAGAAAGFGMGASAGLSAGAGLGASVGVGMTAGAGLGAGAGIDIGVSAGTFGGAGFSAGIGGSASAGMTASGGAFAGLGTSRTTLPSAGFNPDLLLPSPLPPTGTGASFDVSGRVVSGSGQVAASYSAQSGVVVW